MDPANLVPRYQGRLARENKRLRDALRSLLTMTEDVMRRDLRCSEEYISKHSVIDAAREALDRRKT